MPYLGDYLGHLLAEIAMARMQSDVETVRIAELYAAHPLLRFMPVPHVRLPEIDLEIPLLIGKVDAPRPGESIRGGASTPEMRRVFDDTLTAHLARSGIKMTADASRRVAAALDARSRLHGTPVDVSVDVYRLADDLTEVAAKTLEQIREESTPEVPPAPASSIAELKEAARLAFLELRKPPPRVEVRVTSAELREASTPENITRIKLKVSEQGVEWSSVEADGVRRDRLVPE